ncbi:hypothetical protein FQA39_LY11887 [Lamprigera yunnana]|nr:hypothetical protein FQA39_LY11887 [Lamprigera yunnana]
MSTSVSGSGRGRGWMKLKDKGDNKCPGDQDSKKYNDCQYSKLISIFEQIDEEDDGILLNQKLKRLYEVWLEECTSLEEINNSFNVIYSRCLEDCHLATSMVIVMTSCTKVLHDQKIRNLFITALQQNYENRIALRKDSPSAFRNFVRMLGEFYKKIMIREQVMLKVLEAPILKCLKMLVKSEQPADLDLFTNLFLLNGSVFKLKYPEKMSLLLIQIRHLLIYGNNLTTECKTWLLLALDVGNNNFKLLSNKVNKFYEDQLGEKAMARFQAGYTTPKIVTFESKTPDNCQSAVSVLQATPPESTSPVEQSNLVCNTQPQNERRRIGRPILGVGARAQSNGD